jgi:hypothetical protein
MIGEGQPARGAGGTQTLTTASAKENNSASRSREDGHMEARILSAVGKIAGIGGVALGVFLLIFQGVLKQKFLPDIGLGEEHA